MELSAPTHWTTYVQTFAVIASTIGTFVYVYFTYHIMKWAVDQGKANIELAKLTIEDTRQRKAAIDNDIANGLFVDAVSLLMRDWTRAGAGLNGLRDTERFLSDMASKWRTLLKQSLPAEVRVGLQEAWDTMTGAIRRAELARGKLDDRSDEAQIAATMQALNVAAQTVLWQLVALLQAAYGVNTAHSLMKAFRTFFPEESASD